MKTFLKKILLFIIVLVIFQNTVSLLAPYHWGNRWYSSKIQYLENQGAVHLPDTYFFGSSRIYRQINPLVFDSTFNSKSDRRIRSFNLGAPATFNPQVYYLYEHFLDSGLANHTRFAIIELMDINGIGDELLHQERTTYWQNLRDLQFVFNSIYDNPRFGLRNKLEYTRNYLISYFDNLINLGQFGEALIDDEYYKENYVGIHDNGYFPLEYQLEITNDERAKNNLLERKKSLITDDSELVERAEASIEDFETPVSDPNPPQINRIKYLIERSEERGIHLIFLISPRNTSANMVELFRAIDPKNKMEFARADRFPELYRVKYSFDVGHLNTEGAKIYSEMLADKFYEITESIHGD